MDVLRTDVAYARGAVAVNAVPYAPDPRELLHVEVEQLARPRRLVTHDGARRLEAGLVVEPRAPQRGHHGRHREPVVLRDPERGPTLAAAEEELSVLVAGPAAGQPARAARAVGETRVALGAQAGEPLPRGAGRNRRAARCLGDGRARHDAGGERPSRRGRQSCLMWAFTGASGWVAGSVASTTPACT